MERAISACRKPELAERLGRAADRCSALMRSVLMVAGILAIPATIMLSPLLADFCKGRSLAEWVGCDAVQASEVSTWRGSFGDLGYTVSAQELPQVTASALDSALSGIEMKGVSRWYPSEEDAPMPAGDSDPVYLASLAGTDSVVALYSDGRIWLDGALYEPRRGVEAAYAVCEQISSQKAN